MNYLPCSKQIVGKQNDIVVRAACGHRDSPHFKRRVQPADCEQCSLRDGKTECQPHLSKEPTIPPPPPEVVLPAPYPAGTPRPDLISLLAKLPIFKEGRDRPANIDPDGVITYTQETDDWEPPRQIEGYQRDPENKWRFTPLWPKCIYHAGGGVRYANCGCIGIVMRCNNPAAPQFADRVDCAICTACKLRAEP